MFTATFIFAFPRLDDLILRHRHSAMMIRRPQVTRKHAAAWSVPTRSETVQRGETSRVAQFMRVESPRGGVASHVACVADNHVGRHRRREREPEGNTDR